MDSNSKNTKFIAFNALYDSLEQVSCSNNKQAASNTIKRLQPLFALLDELNMQLRQIIPQYLTEGCHIGGVNTARNYIIIFIADQEIAHILKGMHNHILHNLRQVGHDFDGILFKITPNRRYMTHANYQ